MVSWGYHILIQDTRPWMVGIPMEYYPKLNVTIIESWNISYPLKHQKQRHFVIARSSIFSFGPLALAYLTKCITLIRLTFNRMEIFRIPDLIPGYHFFGLGYPDGIPRKNCNIKPCIFNPNPLYVDFGKVT